RSFTESSGRKQRAAAAVSLGPHRFNGNLVNPGGPTRYVSRITGDSGTPRQIGLLRQSVAKAVCKDTHESPHFATRKRADPTRLVTIRQNVKSSYLDHCLPYYTGSLRQSRNCC